MIYDAADKDCCALPASLAMRLLANSLRMLLTNQIRGCLVRKANIDAMFTEELFHSQLTVTKATSFPLSEPRGFCSVYSEPLGPIDLCT